jgi:putative transposase
VAINLGFMSNYKRNYVPGATFFFTVVTYRRQPILAIELARRCLREAILTVQKDHPFAIDAWVLLPDHLHTLWTLPAGDADFSTRWKLIKESFTESYLAAGGTEGHVSLSRKLKKERGVWQRRFWEHTIDGEDDYIHHFDYLHYNPVKHRLVKRVRDYPWSTFHRYVKEGIYPATWGEGEIASPIDVPEP